jgi:multisubunit Na+/H+ antiporter MnhB subunit
MSVNFALTIVLALLVLAAAGWTVTAPSDFAAVVGFVIYGLLLALVWMRLRSVDIALTEAAIGSGVTGVLLLGAGARLRSSEEPPANERPGVAQHVMAAVLCTSITAGLAVVVLILPEPAPTLAPSAAAHLAGTGLGNPVAAVLLAYRALDTLLEAAVLPLALIGVWSLASDRFWGGRPGIRHHADRDGVLVFLPQLLVPFGVLMGIHLVWVGSDDPGGKFQGGTILAAMWILTMMAGINDTPPISRRWLRSMLVAGPLVFLAIGLIGFAVPGAFLAYPPGWAKPLILLIEAALTPSIAAALGLLPAGPPERAAKE